MRHDSASRASGVLETIWTWVSLKPFSGGHFYDGQQASRWRAEAGALLWECFSVYGRRGRQSLQIMIWNDCAPAAINEKALPEAETSHSRQARPAA